jgi:hypothetical protein
MELVFEWDEQKAESNERKHGIGFREAKTVFGDPLALTVFDAGHSDDEDRFRTMGVSDKGRVVVVVFLACPRIEVQREC